MSATRTAIIVSAAALLFAACSGSGSMERRPANPTSTLLSMLDQGIGQLDSNISNVKNRISDLQRLPETDDQTLRDLRAMDLAGWTLHQQQWALQRDHLIFAKQHIKNAQASPEDRPRLLKEWTIHEQQYESTLDDLRKQRHDLERKRFQVEAQLIERHLK